MPGPSAGTGPKRKEQGLRSFVDSAQCRSFFSTFQPIYFHSPSRPDSAVLMSARTEFFTLLALSLFAIAGWIFA